MFSPSLTEPAGAPVIEQAAQQFEKTYGLEYERFETQVSQFDDQLETQKDQFEKKKNFL